MCLVQRSVLWDLSSAMNAMVPPRIPAIAANRSSANGPEMTPVHRKDPPQRPINTHARGRPTLRARDERRLINVLFISVREARTH